jgi:type II secretory pathway component PulF
LGVIFGDALRFMVDTLGADRAAVLSTRGRPSYRALKVWATRGISKEGFWDGEPVSLQLFEQVYDSGRPLLLADAQNDLEASAHISVGLSGIRSVICFPFFNSRGEVIGLLYADSLVRTNSFRASHVNAVKEYVRGLEERLDIMAGGRHAEAADKVVKAHLRTRVPTPKPRTPKPTAKQPAASQTKPVVQDAPQIRCKLESVAFFLRCLSTTCKVGINLDRGVLLASPAEDPGARRIAEYLSQALRSGLPLSEAMHRCSKTFSDFQVTMVRLGERSGSLHEVLEHVADYEEKRLTRWRELKSALAYPLCILAVCLLLLVVAPPYLLAGQKELLQTTGTELPLISRVVFGISDFLTGYGGWFLGLCAVGALIAGRAKWQSPGFRRAGWNLLLTVGGISQVVRIFGVNRFCHALYLQLRCGVLLSEALPRAGKATSIPLFEEAAETAFQALKEGGNLSECLGSTGQFPPLVTGLVKAGEESGALETSLESAWNLTGLELDSAYKQFAALLQPLIMLVMGVLVGIMMIATMLPMVRALNAL